MPLFGKKKKAAKGANAEEVAEEVEIMAEVEEGAGHKRQVVQQQAAQLQQQAELLRDAERMNRLRDERSLFGLTVGVGNVRRALLEVMRRLGGSFVLGDSRVDGNLLAVDAGDATPKR